MFGCIFSLATLAIGIASGLERMSFWWAVIPALVAAPLMIANSPQYDRVLKANREGRLSVFPTMLLTHFVTQMGFAYIAFLIARGLS